MFGTYINLPCINKCWLDRIAKHIFKKTWLFVYFQGLLSYECILDIEGEEVRVPSTTFNETYILCDDKQVKSQIMLKYSVSYDFPNNMKVMTYCASIYG